MANNLLKYRLNGEADLRALRARMGDTFVPFQAKVFQLLNTIPVNDWYDFTRSVHPTNYEAFIKVVCDYIDRFTTIKDYVEFNNTFTAIRRVIWEEPKPNPATQPPKKVKK